MSTNCFPIALVIWLVIVVPTGFTETFLSRPSRKELDETVIQGIVCGNAVRERELAVNGNRPVLPYCGPRQPYFASLQQELERLAPQYIDNVKGPLNSNCTAFLFFSLATWRTSAGLNASGFRRFTGGITFSNGIAQTRDVIGVWLFEDLKAGFGTLKWTAPGCSVSWRNAVGYHWGRIVPNHWIPYSTWTEAKAVAESSVVPEGSWPCSISGGWYFNPESRKDHPGGFPSYNAQAFAVSASPTITLNFTSSISRTIDVYFQGNRCPGGYPSGNTYDDNGSGFQNGTWQLVESVAGSIITTNKLSVVIGHHALPAWCNEPTNHCNYAPETLGMPFANISRGYQISSPAVISKWNFTK